MAKKINNKTMNETSVVCPVCGAKFAIPEHEHAVSGVAIGKDSGMGTVVLPLEGIQNAAPSKTDGISKALQDRIDEMTKRGISTDQYFSITNSKGEGTLMSWKDGVPVAVSVDELDDILNDPTAQQIFDNGYIKNTKLHRRWVMSHMFQMLSDKSGFTGALRRRGYEYMWSMLIEEFRVQSVLAKLDRECFLERNMFFDYSTAMAVVAYDINEAKKLVEYRKAHCTHKCKGVPYIRINGKDVFIDDINKKYILPILNLQSKLARLKDTEDVHSIYNILCVYNNVRINLKRSKMCREFVDAFKGAGAYYTAKNMIQFHGCQVQNGPTWLSTTKSVDDLKKKAIEYRGEGWRMFAYMKKLIEDNKFDFKARMKRIYGKK